MLAQLLCLLTLIAPALTPDDASDVERSPFALALQDSGEFSAPFEMTSEQSFDFGIERPTNTIVRGQSPLTPFDSNVSPAPPPTNQPPEDFFPPTYYFPQIPPEVERFIVPEGYNVYSDRIQLAGLFNPYVKRSPFPMQGPYVYRCGWSKYDDITYMAPEHTKGVPGSFQDTEWNTSVIYAQVLPGGWIFTGTGAANARYWSGPSGVALPGQVDILAADLELTSNNNSPWILQLGFTPQLASDFRRQLNSGAYNFDGRLIMYYQASPNLTLALGAAIWNRVNNIFLPNAGVIWIPNDRWEFRILFPKSQINHYVGRIFNIPHWAYASWEYNVEAYQVDIEDTRFKDRMQISDYRVLAGLTSQWGRLNSFAEGGWVYDRKVKFQGPTPDFTIGNGPMVRVGFKY